ncbi:hypothetical protein BCR44DRAFT_1194549 [Catenaria anguillulae PL171]|uniref:Secreted protein n=1 Tax=Catenaria anguillulae PL171 TaxID=765915 RepID=A0A1Y2HGB2_9FUNG|nr:hypothetical protein BCR44DRAFT_1194549 [Catenaria anguillulae PL171]
MLLLLLMLTLSTEICAGRKRQMRLGLILECFSWTRRGNQRLELLLRHHTDLNLLVCDHGKRFGQGIGSGGSLTRIEILDQCVPFAAIARFTDPNRPHVPAPLDQRRHRVEIQVGRKVGHMDGGGKMWAACTQRD